MTITISVAGLLVSVIALLVNALVQVRINRLVYERLNNHMERLLKLETKRP